MLIPVKDGQQFIGNITVDMGYDSNVSVNLQLNLYGLKSFGIVVAKLNNLYALLSDAGEVRTGATIIAPMPVAYEQDQSAKNEVNP